MYTTSDKHISTYTYTDHKTGTVVAVIDASCIGQADDAFEQVFKQHPKNLKHVGVEIEFVLAL